MSGARQPPAPAGRPGPSNSRLTRSSWRPWPNLKLRAAVENTASHRLAAHRSRCSRRQPARRRPASLSCRRSWPGPATSTITIVKCGSAQRSPRRRCCTSWERPRSAARHRRRSSKAILMRSGHGVVHLLATSFSGTRFSVSIPLSPDSEERPLAASGSPDTARLRSRIRAKASTSLRYAKKINSDCSCAGLGRRRLHC